MRDLNHVAGTLSLVSLNHFTIFMCSLGYEVIVGNDHGNVLFSECRNMCWVAYLTMYCNAPEMVFVATSSWLILWTLVWE